MGEIVSLLSHLEPRDQYLGESFVLSQEDFLVLFQLLEIEVVTSAERGCSREAASRYFRVLVGRFKGLFLLSEEV